MSSQKIFDKLLELFAPAAQTASTNNPAVTFEYGKVDEACVEVNVTAMSGTGGPTCAFALQVSNDGGTTWKTVAQQQPITAIGRYELCFSGMGASAILAPSAVQANNQVRIATTITGTTPSFTFGAWMTKC